jgi:hypothetical protein
MRRGALELLFDSARNFLTRGKKFFFLPVARQKKPAITSREFGVNPKPTVCQWTAILVLRSLTETAVCVVRASSLSNRKPKGGTNFEYIVARLERDKHHRLLEGIRSGQLSAYAAGVAAGYFKRRKTVCEPGTHNKSKRIAWDIRALIG